MNYLEIYENLERIDGMTTLNRLRMTYRIGRTSPQIRSAIMDYLDSGCQDWYKYPEEITATVCETVDGEDTVVEYSCEDIQKKFRLANPLSTLLYIDWLRKDPDAAILYSRQIDTVVRPPREEIEKQIDPRILALAKEKERRMIESLEKGLDREIEDECQNDENRN